MTRAFTHRCARSAPLLGTLVFLVAGETAGVHWLLFPRAPVVAVALSATGLAALWWLVADFVALGRDATTVDGGTIFVRVGRRVRVEIPVALVASAIAPAWSDLPAAPEKGYLNATKPAEPNVLVTLREPVPARLPGGVKRPVRRIALAFDEPGAFLAAVGESAEAAGSGAA